MIPISFNRYALICRPFTHHAITSQKSALIQITALTVFALTTNVYELYRKQMSWLLYKVCVLIISVILSVVFPLLVTFILTVLVTREFRRMNRTLVDFVNAGAFSRQGERNMTRAMIAVNVAFIVLILPSMLLHVILYFSNVKFGNNWNLASLWLTLISDINFSINIFVYTFCLPKFRATLLGLFTCKCCMKRRNESFAMSVV